MSKEEAKTEDTTTKKLPDTPKTTPTEDVVIAPPCTMVVKGEKGLRDPNVVKIDNNSD